MASFWFWIGAVFLSLIFGALLIFLIYGGINFFSDMVKKKGIPKSKNKVSEYIKEHPEKFEKTNSGLPSEIEKKEVLENERKRKNKYREFEKLRREDLRSREVGRTTNERGGGVSDVSENTDVQRGSNLPSNANPRTTESRRTIKLDD